MASEISSSGMLYRSKHDIRATILELLSTGPLGRTKILYGAYLSQEQLNQYLAFMTEKGLVEEASDRKIALTQKGRKYLKALQHADAILKEAVA